MENIVIFSKNKKKHPVEVRSESVALEAPSARGKQVGDSTKPRYVRYNTIPADGILASAQKLT